MAQTTFYILGGILVLCAVLVSAIGLRYDKFPRSKTLFAIVAVVFGLVVVVTAAAALNAARDEEAHRIAEENEEAAELAEEMAEEFDEGMADEETGEAGESEAPADADVLAQGQQVFTSQGCGSCHILAAAGSTGEVGPNLDETLAAQDPTFIEASIVDPDAEIADGFSAGSMPQTYGTQISPEDLAALVTFISESTSSGE
ncbi:MAG: c-type cytochrome [Solirubrobacterales bacterium]